MRKMTEKEIRRFIEEWTWGTILAVDGNKPYAVDGYCKFWVKANIACDSDKYFGQWRAVIEGEAERLTKRDDCYYSVNLFSNRYGFSKEFFHRMAEKMSSNPERSSLIRLPIQNISGVCSP
ncbi:MAG: hypothetical protein KAQ81_02230 [Deltaproteobacteria bacterium]|nr:hypothetical protein [Deltaproteobacteria bacterium]